MHSHRSGTDDRNLDVLRAIAVLLVLVTHTINATIAPESAKPFLSILGNDGVIIFFVHTSLVLMRSIERTHVRGLRGWPQARDFYVRRAFRIYPLAVLTVLVVVSFGLRREPLDLRFIPPGSHEMAANLTLTQNLWGLRSVLAPLWSLPYEIQMYLLLPLLFLFVRHAKAKWQLITLAVLSITVALVYVRLVTWVPVLWRLSVINYLPCFAAGIIAYRACQLARPRMAARAWPIIVLLVVLGSPFLRSAMLTGFRRGWLVAFVIAAFIPLVRELSESAFTRSAHVIAKYSYGIYLSHIPVLDIAVRSMQQEPLWVRALAATAGLVFLPFLLYHTVEQPMIQVGSGVASRLSRRPEVAPTLASAAPAP